DHIAALDVATSLPVSADLENGYGPEPEDAARAIERAAEAGAVGGSIEDYDPSGFLYEPEHAVERVAAAVAAAGSLAVPLVLCAPAHAVARVAAAVEAAGSLAFPFVLSARAENHIRGNPDLDDTIARLQSYERVGADVLYAPGLGTVEEIRAVCSAVSKPVNV